MKACWPSTKKRAICTWDVQVCASFSTAVTKGLPEPFQATADAEQASALGRRRPRPLAALNQALVESERTELHWYDAELHRTRGEILIKHNPADPAPAETAFLAAIAIAPSQKARSFDLRAALDLAKLYQSTGRPIGAHDVLGPALEGFSPTLEFPEIVEAMRFLGANKAVGEQS
jgi:hypothetical protein